MMGIDAASFTAARIDPQACGVAHPCDRGKADNNRDLHLSRRGGDVAESHVAHRLRCLEREMENNPYVADAVLTVSEPGE
jgi:hypothetical protein